MTTNIVNVFEPTQFGIGDGATTEFQIGGPREVVQSIAPTGVWLQDWQGNQRLYPTPRTNIVRNSVYRAASWARSGNAVVNANIGTGPDGSQTSAFLTTAATDAPYTWAEYNSFVAGTTYTASAWFKINPASPSRRVRLLFHQQAFGVNRFLLFDVSSGAISTFTANAPQAFGSEAYPGGWVRVWLTATATITATTYAPLIWFNDNIAPGEGVEFWGVQQEFGENPTSYIPTNGAAVTVADYTVSPSGLFSMGQVPAIGASLTWTGSYTYEYREDAPTLADRTVISQYANSPTLRQLIHNMDEYINPDTDFDAFYDYVWNVETAQGFGLDVWGRIVGVGRMLTIPAAETYLGYQEAYTIPTAATGAQPFGQAPMYVGTTSSQTYRLADDAYRKLILVKALANISDCTSPSLNRLLTNLFAGRGRCYVSDTGQMEFRYVFEFALEPYEIAILTQSGAIPKPAAVLANVLQVDLPNTFGFNEALMQPFGSGVFFTSSGLINAS